MENFDPQSGPPMAAGLPAMAPPQALQPPEDDEPKLDPDKTLDKLEKWGKAIDRHWADWLAEAKETFNIVAGHQWTEKERQDLEDANKIPVVFNRVGPVLDAVCGAEILGRQEVKYYPRQMGSAAVNEIITRGAEWIRDRCDAPGEESEAFRDCFICGLGYTETRFDFEEDSKGQIVIEGGEAMKCLPDPNARRANAVDKRYLRFRNEMGRDEFEEMYPDEDGAYDVDPDVPRRSSSDPRDDYDADKQKGKDADTVTVDLWQWYETEWIVRTPTMDGTSTIDLPQDKFDNLQAMARMANRPPLRGVKLKRRCYYEAVVTGKRFLKEPMKLPHKKFRFEFVTGKRDKIDGVWYGLVRPMKDPQRWANSLFSMVLHIIRTNAKGGLVVERGAVTGENPVADQKKFEESWAKSDAITFVEDGALSQERIKPKTPPQIPAAMASLFEQSITAIRDVSGVSAEMMGLTEINQPGVLEHQRKQSSFAMLASFFDSFRRYRKFQGELMLEMMRDLPKGTLVRVIGEDGNQAYVPLVMDEDVERYDVIVDDAPTGPNEKDKTWSLIMQVLPTVKDIMTPQVWMEILRYSPFPESLVNKLREMITAAPQDQQKQMMEQMMQQLQMITLRLGIQEKQTNITKSAADARKTNAEAQATEVGTRLNVMNPDPHPQVTI